MSVTRFKEVSRSDNKKALILEMGVLYKDAEH